MPLASDLRALALAVAAIAGEAGWAHAQELSSHGLEPFAVIQAVASEPPAETNADAGTPQQPADRQPPEAQTPPEPRHTGFQALVRTTAADFAAFPRRQSTWVILTAGAGAAALTHPLDDDLNARMKGSRNVGRFFAAGKWVGSTYVTVGVAGGLYLVGRYVLPPAEGQPGTNKLSHLGFDLIRAQIVSQTIVHTMKATIRRDRPTGECCAFPSGHAASAFATASVLERHLGYRAAWPTLAIATYVGASRLHDNRHFISDVMFGSAVGIATGWTIVGRHGRSEYALLPLPVQGGMGVMVTRVQ